MFTPTSCIRSTGKARTGVLAGAGAWDGAREGTRFAAVAVSAPQAVLPAAPSGPAAGAIEIEFATGARMRIAGPVGGSASTAIERWRGRQRR